MTDKLRTIWQSEQPVSAFTDTRGLEKRRSKFERTIRRRNLIEYAAGVLVLVVMVPSAVQLATGGEIALACMLALTLMGAGVVLWNLHHRTSLTERRPEQDCRSHLVAQYRRQATALRGVPLWYIGPIAPGILGFYAVLGAKVAGRQSVQAILANIGIPLALTLAFFAIAIWLNLRSARGLERKARELESG